MFVCTGATGVTGAYLVLWEVPSTVVCIFTCGLRVDACVEVFSRFSREGVATSWMVSAMIGRRLEA